MSGGQGTDGATQNVTKNPRMLFTGPDYIRDHRVTVEPEHRDVGIGTMSGEGTSEVDYLWRAAPGTPFPRPKTCGVGGIGWGIEQFTDWSMPVTGRQVMMGEFRQELENRHAHKYQNPWYPGPHDKLDPNSDQARVMNVYRSRSAVPQQSERQPSGSASWYSRHRRRTPAATPLYSTNILSLVTSVLRRLKCEDPLETDQKTAAAHNSKQDNQPVKAY